MALPSTTQSWMNSTNIPNCGHDIPAAAERDIRCYLPLHIAILQGNWENARNFFENDPNVITARLTALSETPLLVAVKARRGILFVRKLVELMLPEELALTDYFGNTALHAVAVLGNITEAKLVVEKTQTCLISGTMMALCLSTWLHAWSEEDDSVLAVCHQR